MNDDAKERVRAAIDLSDFIGREIELKKVGEREWKALCPFHAEKTPSFSVFHKNGSWGFHCFGCDAGGDVFEWIMRRKGLPFPQALTVAANHAGVSLEEAGRHLWQPSEVKALGPTAPAFGRAPFNAEKYRPLAQGSAAHAYLTEKRGLSAELLTDYSVGETTDGAAYSFAYKWRPPGLPENRKAIFEFCKVVNVDRPNGKKEEWRDPKGGKNILFGMCAPSVVAAHDAGGELVICEGEIDAVTWATYGFPAVSVPGGAKYTGWIDICWPWLQAFSKLHISFDEDPAGRMKVVEIVTRLGMSRADIVRLPYKKTGAADTEARFKDANECWLAGVTAEAMAQCVHQPEIIKPDRLKSIYDFEEEIWGKFHPAGKDQIGLALPWGNHYGSSLPFRFRYGEVTVWTGYNKHGKSEVLNHVIVDLCWQGDKAMVCSLEVQAPETYRKLIRMTQARKNVCPPEEKAQFRERCLKPLAQKIWVYDEVGNAAIEDVLAVMLYAYQRYGCRQFVLDSLMRFSGLDGEGQEIWNAQKAFMDRLIQFAATYRVHVHLVAHSKKPGDRRGEASIPRRYDVMGSSYITNLAFNVIVVWRNRQKQDRLEEIFQKCGDLWAGKHRGQTMPPWKRLLGGPPDESAVAEVKASWRAMVDTVASLPADLKEEWSALCLEHDAYFIVDAQRGGDGDCPARHLWFHYDSLQFLEVSPWSDDKDRCRPVKYAARTVAEMDEEL